MELLVHRYGIKVLQLCHYHRQYILQAPRCLHNRKANLERPYSQRAVPHINPSQSEPSTVFVYDCYGMTPISEDADLIYRANQSSLQHFTVQRVEPDLLKHERHTAKENRGADMSDKTGIISRQCIQLAMARNSPSLNGSQPTALFHTHSSNSQQAALKEETTNFEDSLESQKPIRHENTSNDRGNKNLPSIEQLEQVKAKITEFMPQFFVKSHPFNMYSADVVFENNFWGQNKITHGINRYGWEMMKLKVKGNIGFVSINVYVMNITTHPEDGTIKLRWTMRAIPQAQGFMFWKFNLFNIRGKGGIKEKMSKEFKHFDGFNIFWVDKRGAIVRHRLDKMMPDDQKQVIKPVEELTEKIITANGVLSREASTTTNSTT